MVSIPSFLKHSKPKIIKIFSDYLDEVTSKAEKLFAVLFIFQWFLGIIFALLISPRTWNGGSSQVHIHVYAAVFLGGAVAALPIFLIYTQPGRPLTRHIIAFSQMSVSALLIHLSGGRIETHFHVFGSLAFLSFFRDWRILVTATVVSALDHLLRGIFWPQSVYGVLSATPWRSLEHAAWIAFEDVVLFFSIRIALQEAARVAEKENLQSETIESVERAVAERTRELKELQKISVHNAHQTGMSEIATGVLHNVGNVLNSANVGLETIIQKFDTSVTENLYKANDLLTRNQSRLVEFFTTDPKGEKLIKFYLELGAAVKNELSAQKREATELMKKLQLIKDIINTQQTYAKGNAEFKENLSLVEVVESALSMQTNALTRHEIRIIKKFSEVPPIIAQRTKLIHLVLNLIKNAKEAMDTKDNREKLLTLEIGRTELGGVFFSVTDTGVGIGQENLDKIFGHGFTTKQTGHGFGLHFCANAAMEMGARITVSSEGPGRGARFCIEFSDERTFAKAV